MPYGWGTGGVQVTASALTPEDRLKVIDQGADDTTNAVSIRHLFARVAGVATTTRTREALARGAMIVAILHDAETRAAMCDREVDVSAFAPRGGP